MSEHLKKNKPRLKLANRDQSKDSQQNSRAQSIKNVDSDQYNMPEQDEYFS